MAPKPPSDPGPDPKGDVSDLKKDDSAGKKNSSKSPKPRNRNQRKGEGKGKPKNSEVRGENCSDSEEDHVCFICADPITHYAVGSCDHRCCFKCCLRSRALYKSRMCPVCKSDQPLVVFTDDPEKKFLGYDLSTLPCDSKLDIYFDSTKALNDTADLLKFNCPVKDCVFVSKEGYLVLKAHVSSEHEKNFCDLCVTHKRVFYCEHLLYSRDELQLHIKRGSLVGKKSSKKQDDGFRGHPYCAFCRMRFYDSDALFEHCRKNHEECFLCKRRDPTDRSQYQNYQALEEHFSKDHFLCKEKECIEKRFVVFSSEIDLQAHNANEHSDKYAGFQRVRQKQARQININVTFSDRNQEGSSNSQPRTRQTGQNDGSQASASNSLSESSRRIRAPAGFGFSAIGEINDQTVVTEPAPRPIQVPHEEPSSSWPSLDGSTSSTLPSLSAPRPQLKGRETTKDNAESWPGLPSSSKPNGLKTISKPNPKKEQYSKQLLDKRPPLPKKPFQPIVLPPPLPKSMPQSTVLPPPLPRVEASSSKDFIIPFSLQNTVSGLLLRDSGKLVIFHNLVSLFRTGTIGAPEFISQLEELFQQSGSNTTKALNDAMSKTITGLAEILDKSFSKKLSTAFAVYLSKLTAFPDLPSTSKSTGSQPATRKVLVIKEKQKGLGLAKPVRQPTSQISQVPTSEFPSLPSGPGISRSSNGHKGKGKKVVWNNL